MWCRESIQAIAESALHFEGDFSRYEEVESKLVNEGFLFGHRFRDAAQSDLAPTRRRKDDVGARQRGQQSQGPSWTRSAECC